MRYITFILTLFIFSLFYILHSNEAPVFAASCKGPKCATPTPTPTSTPMPTSTNTPTPTPTIDISITPTPTDEITPTPTITVLPTITPTPAIKGIWISQEQIDALPMSGPAWTNLKSRADGALGTANIADQDSLHDVNTLATALVYARTKDEAYRIKAANAVMSAIETENGGRSLALGRNLVSYVIAADLINLRDYDPAKDLQFKTWLTDVRTETMSDGRSLVYTHEKRPNNWGTMAGASRAAAAVYLDDTTDLARTAQVFGGWLGNRSLYAEFIYGDLSWQCDPLNPVGINPVGCTKTDGGQSYDLSGSQPEEMRRGCDFRYPPCFSNYPWGALQGASVQAEILHRQGYDTWNWENQALRRAIQYLYDLQIYDTNWYATGDDLFIPWIINKRYGSQFPTEAVTQPGKNMGWTDWTHGL